MNCLNYVKSNLPVELLPTFTKFETFASQNKSYAIFSAIAAVATLFGVAGSKPIRGLVGLGLVAGFAKICTDISHLFSTFVPTTLANFIPSTAPVTTALGRFIPGKFVGALNVAQQAAKL